MAHAVFEQATGRFVILVHEEDQERVVYETAGYAGRGSGKNNPDAQSVRAHGPIPVGHWRIGRSFNHLRFGPLVSRLNAMPGTETYGRSGFLIHGDSKTRPGDASSGCIILGRAAREAIHHWGPRHLEVVAQPVPDPAKAED